MNRALDRRRLLCLLALFIICFGALGGKLLDIQLLHMHHYSSGSMDLAAASVRQRQEPYLLDTGRAQFFDRKHRSLTGRTMRTLVLYRGERGNPLFRTDTAALKQLERVLHTDSATWRKAYEAAVHPSIWMNKEGTRPVALTPAQALAIGKLQLPGVYVLPYSPRYSQELPAQHLIGYVAKDPERVKRSYPLEINRGILTPDTPVGAAGLEKSLDRLLLGVGETSLRIYVDGRKKPLHGLDLRLAAPRNPFYPLKVATTLDLEAQKRIERLLDASGLRQGAVVVLDAANADVIAMASRPAFDPSDVHPERGDWGNRALKAIAPGSIFKTVTAAAALQEHAVLPGESFDCPGSLGRYGLKCWKQDGHGLLTFREAYAESCNVTFAKVMERLSAEQLERYASWLGFGRRIGWRGRMADGSMLTQFDREEPGTIFAGERQKADGGARIQSAIGQRDVRVTPLQAANMVVTLLNGGKLTSPRAVKEIRYRNLQLKQPFAVHPAAHSSGLPEGRISPATAKTLLHWMDSVVQEGTGRALKQASWRLAGKSGTAEVTADGRDAVNQWFVGYGPVDRPRYAVAVVAENRSPDSANLAITLFRQIMDALAQMEARR